MSGKNLEEHCIAISSLPILSFQKYKRPGSIYIWALVSTGSLPQLWANHDGRNPWAIVNELLPCFNTILSMLMIANSEISYGFLCELLFTIYFNHLKFKKRKEIPVWHKALGWNFLRTTLLPLWMQCCLWRQGLVLVSISFVMFSDWCRLGNGKFNCSSKCHWVEQLLWKILLTCREK